MLDGFDQQNQQSQQNQQIQQIQQSQQMYLDFGDEGEQMNLDFGDEQQESVRRDVENTLENFYKKWGNPTESDRKWIDLIIEGTPKLFSKIKGKVIFEKDFITINGIKFYRKVDPELINNDNGIETKIIEGIRKASLDETHDMFMFFLSEGGLKGLTNNRDKVGLLFGIKSFKTWDKNMIYKFNSRNSELYRKRPPFDFQFYIKD